LPERSLILASRSPQRRALLQQLGLEFSVQIPEGVEELESGPPDEVAAENAYRKAVAVAARAQASLVLGVDTVVSVGTRIYGKPDSEATALETLAALSGRRHTVTSGLCLIFDERVRTTTSTTLVQFRTLDRRLVDWYLASGEWRDRAGAYAIQGRGAALVAEIDGDYTNVVGLPIATLLDLAPELLTL
jgi:septum formation protein